MANEQLSCEVGEYHAQDGVFFKRVDDGAVRVRWPGGEIVLHPGVWASAVANVCAVGETGTTWAAANALHDGMPDAPLVMSKSVDTVLLTVPTDFLNDPVRVERVRSTMALNGLRCLVVEERMKPQILRGTE